MGEAIPIPRQLPADSEMRLRRLRSLAWLLDRSVGVGGKAGPAFSAKERSAEYAAR